MLSITQSVQNLSRTIDEDVDEKYGNITGISLNNTNMQTFRFADDQIIIVQGFEDIE